MKTDNLTYSFLALRDKLHRSALRFLKNDEDARDALQDTFFNLWREGRIHKFFMQGWKLSAVMSGAFWICRSDFVILHYGSKEWQIQNYRKGYLSCSWNFNGFSRDILDVVQQFRRFYNNRLLLLLCSSGAFIL